MEPKKDFCANCGGDRKVAEQTVLSQKRGRDGLMEMELGEEKLFCKKCGAPWAVKGEKTLPGTEAKLLDGPPEHLKDEKDKKHR